MSSFPDKNAWYQLTQLSTGLAMTATHEFEKGVSEGSIFFQGRSYTAWGQFWNFFPVGTGTYVLRTSGSSHVYLDVDQSKTPAAPYFVNASIATNGSNWDVVGSPGTADIFITNRVVGGEWSLMVNSGGVLAFERRDFKSQDAQRFRLVGYLDINDPKYSSIDAIPTFVMASSTSSKAQPTLATPQLTSTASSTIPSLDPHTVPPDVPLSVSTTTVSLNAQTAPNTTDISTTSSTKLPTLTTSTSSTTRSLVTPQSTLSTTNSPDSQKISPSSQAENGLSPPAIWGISIIVGIIALIFLLGSGIMFWRRRKLRGRSTPEDKVQKLQVTTILQEERLVTREAYELEVPTAELQNERENRWELSGDRGT